MKDKQAIEAWVLNWVEKKTDHDTDDIDFDEPFVNLGFGSAEAVAFVVDLEEWLAMELDPALLWEFATVSEFLEYLLENQ